MERRDFFRRVLAGGVALWLPGWFEKKKTYIFMPGFFKPPRRLWRVELADWSVSLPTQDRVLLAFYHHFDDGSVEGPFNLKECKARHERLIATGRVKNLPHGWERPERFAWERENWTKHRLVQG